MNIKSLLLGSAAALVAVSGARAADAIIAAEPEPVEYVRVCDAFGTGYFYIPGTETCLRISGYVRYDIGVGERFEQTSVTGDGTYNKRARLSLRTNTASETELGTLRTYTETRFQWDSNAVAGGGYTNDNEVTLNFAWVQLGGLRVGKDESAFITFTGYAGNVVKDDELFSAGPYDTNLVSYTYNSGPLSAIISLEQGENNSAATNDDWAIDDYMPHVVAGLGYNAGMFNLRGVVAYDSRDDIGGFARGGWAAKLRAYVTLNDQFSMFAMALYGENSSGYTTWRNIGLSTDETWAAVVGASYQATDRLALNIQGNWVESTIAGIDDGWSVVADMNYTVVPGLVVTPGVAWVNEVDAANADGEFGGYLRVQRSF
ncbi:porin [Hoeflea olei]|uniref:Porin n=1 Tax=Hoeflea olei TaxID=1480615 RepID=A0A1C1YVY3_9HYPH|nr:porin [Hoeflea olei]OCW57693.1 hypothetical protein AWJ14_02480 [Hoeflea olei]